MATGKGTAMSKIGRPARIRGARLALRDDLQKVAARDRLRSLQDQRGRRQAPQQAGNGQEPGAPAAEAVQRKTWVPRGLPAARREAERAPENVRSTCENGS